MNNDTYLKKAALGIYNGIAAFITHFERSKGFTSANEEFKYMTKELFHLPLFILSFANLINLMVCHFDFKDADARACLKKSRVPVLFMHSKADTFVPTYMGLENYEACSSEKEIKLFEGVAHARSLFKYPEEYKRCVLDFLAKYF